MLLNFYAKHRPVFCRYCRWRWGSGCQLFRFWRLPLWRKNEWGEQLASNWNKSEKKRYYNYNGYNGVRLNYSEQMRDYWLMARSIQFRDSFVAKKAYGFFVFLLKGFLHRRWSFFSLSAGRLMAVSVDLDVIFLRFWN